MATNGDNDNTIEGGDGSTTDKARILKELISLVKQPEYGKWDPLPVQRLKETLDGKDGAAILRAHGPTDLTLLYHIVYHKDVTLDLVKWLVELYPEAVKHDAGQGFFPLHHACDNETIDLDIVQYLIGLYPEALMVERQRLDETPLASLLKEYSDNPPRLDLIELIIRKCPDCVRIKKQESTVCSYGL